MRLVGYVRVSKVAGREGDRFQSPKVQREAIEGACQARGATLVDVIIDLDESGGSLDRPGLKQALQMIDSGDADGIAVAKLDRFTRSSSGITVIEDLTKRGKAFVSAADSLDTSTSMGRFALGMMVLVAQLERDRHIETWAESTRQSVGRGVHQRVPYGYDRSNGRGSPLIIREDEAKVVRRIFRERALGFGAAAIETDLNADGIPSPSGRAWTRQTVRFLLRNPAYTGEARHGESVNREAHPAIVSRPEWEAVQRDRPVGLRGEGRMLSGLLRCAGCGYTMGASNTKWGQRYGCQRITAAGKCVQPTTCNAVTIEEFVADAFLDRFGENRMIAASSGNELVVKTAAGRDRALTELEQWRDDTEMRVLLGPDHYRAGLLARSRALDEAQAAHDAAVRQAGAASMIVPAAVWDVATVAERRLLLSRAIDTVWLRRAIGTHAPIGGRVVIGWVGEGDARPGLVPV